MKNNPARIILIAMACSPDSASEADIAWKCILALQGHVSLTVVTHSNQRSNIENFLSRRPSSLKETDFLYIGKPIIHHPNQFLARLLIWKHYKDWMSDVVSFLTNRNLTDNHDLCHHVTFSTWRLGSPFWQCGLPTVWGPIGGGGRVPWRCLRFMSPQGIAIEILRDVLSCFYRLTSTFLTSLKNNTIVLASNQETAAFLGKAAARPIQVTFPTWFSPESIIGTEKSQRSGSLLCFTGGGVIASKGIGYSLRAIRKSLDSGINIRLEIAGYGPERAFLEKQIDILDLRAFVSFLPLLSGNDYQTKLREADVFLFPSFRENIGITMVEAMLCEQAPIVLNRSAPSEIVTSECGWIVPSDNTSSIVSGIATALQEAAENGELLRSKQKSARARIAAHFSIETYRRKILESYTSALAVQNKNRI